MFTKLAQKAKIKHMKKQMTTAYDSILRIKKKFIKIQNKIVYLVCQAWWEGWRHFRHFQTIEKKGSLKYKTKSIKIDQNRFSSFICNEKVCQATVYRIQ